MLPESRSGQYLATLLRKYCWIGAGIAAQWRVWLKHDDTTSTTKGLMGDSRQQDASGRLFSRAMEQAPAS